MAFVSSTIAMYIRICTVYYSCATIAYIHTYVAAVHSHTDDLNEIRYKITSLVLQYCVEDMQDGWKEWVKIAAWLYVHVRK